MTIKEKIIVKVLLNEPFKDLLEDMAKIYHIKLKRKKVVKNRQTALIEFIKNDKPMSEILNNLYSLK